MHKEPWGWGPSEVRRAPLLSLKNCNYKMLYQPRLSVSLSPSTLQKDTVPNTTKIYILIASEDCLGNLKFSVEKAGVGKGQGRSMCSHQPGLRTFARVVLNRLLECSYVTERAKEQNHLILLIPDRSDLHKKPHGRP